MLFNKKSKISCVYCNRAIEKKFDFCPYCGRSAKSPQELQKDFGLLGNSDEALLENPMAAMGMLGQIIAPMMQGIMKSLSEEDAGAPEIQQLPNGISIRMGGPKQPKKKRQEPKPLIPQITERQIQRISELPRATAKTKLRRFEDKVICDIDAPGIQAIEDILVSKLESGYEIKAIGKNKVYTNSISINLPLKQYSFDDKGISMEFSLQQ